MDATLTFVTFLAILAMTFGRPQDTGLSFPEETNSENESGNRQSFRPPQGNFRPQQSNFLPQQGNFRPQQGNNFQPQQGNFQQQGNLRPQQGNFQQQGNSQESFGRPNQGPPSQGNFQPVPFDQSNQAPSTPRQTQRPAQQTTVNDGSTQTTTRIPPRDPANRIIYILPKGCNCPFTPQYNPVCGTDGQTYGNMGVLQCARQCGTQVDVYLVGACGRNNG